MTIGTRIFNARKALRLTQVALAKKANKAQSFIAYLEGDGPNIGSSSRLDAIASALNVNVHWLETGQGSPETDYVHPDVVNKKYCPEIEDVISLMESTDERGREKARLAVKDALDAHNAWKNSLPRAQDAEADRIEESLNRHLGQELIKKVFENEKPSSGDAYKVEDLSGVRTDKNH